MFNLSLDYASRYFCLDRKFLVSNLVSRNLKIKYRRSYLGIFWTILAPISTALMYYFVFIQILGIKIPNYLAFIVSGVLTWSFFAQTVVESTDSLVLNWSLITKIPIPIQVFPLTNVITNFATLVFSVPVIIGIALISKVPLSFGMLFFTLYFPILFLYAYSFSVIFSIAFVFLRDLKHILNILMQLWFYGTPILYNPEMVPERYHWILYLNPLALLFKGIRLALIEGKALTLNESCLVVGEAVAICLLSYLFYKRIGPNVVESL